MIDNAEKALLYFADCEAATSERYNYTKSLSKGERRRHGAICARLLEYLEHGDMGGKESRREDVISRLKKAIEGSGFGGL